MRADHAKTKNYCMTRFFGHGQSILQVFETSIALSMVKSVKSPFFQTLLVPISWTLAIYEAIIRPALTYESECWAMKVTNKRKIATTEMRMLRGILGVSRRDHMRNEDIRRILNISPIDEVMRCGRLRWFGHVQRRDADNVTRRVMNLAIPGTRRRGRPN